MKNRAVTLALVTLSCAAGLSRGGTFLTATIDGNFAEWEAVPVLDADPADNANSVDIADIRIANDSDFLYISYIHHAATPTVPTFVSLDVDSNAATGFDVFGLGLAGAMQAISVYNAAEDDVNPAFPTMGPPVPNPNPGPDLPVVL